MRSFTTTSLREAGFKPEEAMARTGHSSLEVHNTYYDRSLEFEKEKTQGIYGAIATGVSSAREYGKTKKFNEFTVMFLICFFFCYIFFSY